MGYPLKRGAITSVSITIPAANRWLTRWNQAIGTGMSYEVEPIDFAGGSASVSNALPRQVNYYSVEIPANQKSWKVKLSQGEAELAFEKTECRLAARRG